jgi:Cu+-exporting ATPase
MSRKDLKVDPVCGMNLEPEKAYSHVTYEGHVLYFCSRKCEEKFKENPRKYLSRVRKEDGSMHEHHG